MRPVDTLRHHMEVGSTGTITVHLAGGRAIAVYLMQGEILAAETPEDGLDVVARLENAGALGAEAATGLRERLLRSGRVGDVLFGAVSDDLLMELYTRRFRENLARYLVADGAVSFAEQETIHVENVQVGHDSYDLLEDLAAQIALIAPLLATEAPVFLAEGDAPPSSARQARVVGRLAGDGSLEGLLARSPYEPIETLVHVAALLDSGALVRRDAAGGAALAEPVIVDEADASDDLAMFRDHDRRKRGSDGSFSVSRDLLDKVDLSGFSLFDDLALADEHVLEMEDGDKLDASSGAVNLCFTSPPLTSEDAAHKVEVTNEVLRQICQALDDEHGGGSGQAAVLLLVESCPVEYAAIFAGIEPACDGAIDSVRAVANLERRSESERRRLLNGALRDLVERGFSITIERVSEARLEVMLQRIAGFQQRLGL